MAKVSQTTIAAQLGLSQRAVSKALANQPGVSEQTRETVKALAGKLGYRSNRLARSLIDGRTRIAGALTPALSGLYMSQLFDAVNAILAENGYNLLMSKWQLQHHRDDEEIETLLQYSVDGIITMPRIEVPLTETLYPDLIRQGKKIVFVNEQYDGENACSVYSDDLNGSAGAMNFLIEQGHRHIACVEVGSGYATSLLLRRQGYEEALANAGIPLRPEYVCNTENEQLEEWLPVLRRHHPEITAVFCFADEAALEVTRILPEMGLRVPKDISVVGYANDIPHPEHMRIPLTTVNQCSETIGKIAAENLLKMLSGRPVDKHIVVPTRLIVRDSTSPPQNREK